MSGQQAFTLAGQIIGGVIGTFVGNPYIGAAIGGAIGSVIGGALFAKETVTEGPRLKDLHVQTSSYGGAVPILKGTCRVAGNVIWASDMRETVIETEEGGKGGGDTQVLREYRYSVDVAIALCEGEVIGIERIFANGVLIYDSRTGTSPQNVFASGQWASSLALYPGTEAQEPDPIIEAAVGVGNASAYRGTAYVVIGNLQLNTLQTATIPNFEFVVVQSGTTTSYARLVAQDGLADTYGLLGVAPLPRVRIDATLVRVVRGDVVKLFDLEGTLLGQDGPNTFETGLPEVSTGVYGFWNMWDGEQAFITSSTGTTPRDLTVGSAPSARAVSLDIESPSLLFCSFTQCADNRHIIALVESGGNAVEWIRFEWDGEALVIDDRGPVDSATVSAADKGAPTALFDSITAGFGEGDLTTIWSAKGNGTVDVDVFRIDGDGLLSRTHRFSLDALANIMTTNASPGVYADNGIAVVVGGDAFQVFSRRESIAQSAVLLSDVVSDLCARADIDPAELDVTDLAQTCDGFVVPQTMTAAAAIAALRPAYFFDVVDSDKLRFVTRGTAIVGQFEADDLGAGVGQAQPVRMLTQIAQETELPARFNVRYISKEGDYQIGAQSQRRETTESIEVVDAEIPCVLQDQYAAKVADVNLRDMWAGAATRSFTTGLKYARHEATDVVTVDDGDVVRTVRITKRVDHSSMIEWEARDEDVAGYDSNAVGMTIIVPPQTPAIAASPTDVEVLDLPPLTTLRTGSESAAYAAIRGYTSPWGGAVLDLSRDAGTTYETAAAGSTASVMGVALTALGSFPAGNVFDEINSVRVDVGAGTLSSSTHANVLNGANLAVVGGEVIQFRTATLVSTGVYDLTGLLRGRKGTEAQIGAHAIADRFVLLNTATLLNVPLRTTDVDSTSLRIRATTVNLLSSGSSSESFTTVLARLKPYSPAHLSAVPKSDGSWSVSWIRRDRYQNDWNSGTDVPNSEASLAFDLEVWDGSVLVDSFAGINAEEYEVPATTFGSPTPGTLTFICYQRSVVVGRGYPAEVTVSA